MMFMMSEFYLVTIEVSQFGMPLKLNWKALICTECFDGCCKSLIVRCLVPMLNKVPLIQHLSFACWLMDFECELGVCIMMCDFMAHWMGAPFTMLPWAHSHARKQLEILIEGIMEWMDVPMK